MFEIVFLGTGGSIPSEGRNHPAIVIRHQSWVLLFDAGEDVQRQFMKARLGLNKPMAIFITHVHADHIIGLPGLLLRMSLLGRRRPLDVYGPPELIEYVKMAQQTIRLGTTFETKVFAIKEGVILNKNGLTVRAFPVDHHGLSFGYEVAFQRATGAFHPERAESLDIPKGRLWGQLAKGKSVEINGRLITPDEVTDPPPPPIRVVYTGDTRPCRMLETVTRNADVLISEAMYTSDKQELAEERGHMTARAAAEIALKADVKNLILTHYSTRYDLEGGLPILLEARTIFPKAILAHDLMRVFVDWDGFRIQEAK